MQLFKTTTAQQLFDPVLRRMVVLIALAVRWSRRGMSQVGRVRVPTASTDRTHFRLVLTLQSSSASRTRPAGSSAADLGSERRRIFKQIIVKCVLQLLLIETTQELLQNEEVYQTMPASQLLRLTSVLEDSYTFSKRFNADKELRVALWKVGFMKQLPNLLKQESSSAATLVHILVRMHGDARPAHIGLQTQIRDKLVPLGYDIVSGFLPLDRKPRRETSQLGAPSSARSLPASARSPTPARRRRLPSTARSFTRWRWICCPGSRCRARLQRR